MIKKEVFQLGLFDENICEVEHDHVRYVLRRNPMRAEEFAASRASRIAAVKALAEQQNQYLAEHPKANDYKSLKKVWEKEGRLKLNDYLTITCSERKIEIEGDEEDLAKEAELDGCYCIKTNLPAEAASKEKVHDRYKDLADVELSFRTCKSGHLEVRPIFVRTEKRTRAHVFIVMLAYLLRLELKAAWDGLNVTVEEGLKQLSTLCAIENEIPGRQIGFLSVPAPRDGLEVLFTALNIAPPSTLPHRIGKVDTKTKLCDRRKNL